MVMDTGQWLSCFDSCQLTILWMSNVKDVDLSRHAWDTPPFLLIVSPTPPVQSVDAYVRSVNHVTTKRKEVDHNLWVWGSVPRALRARRSPAIISRITISGSRKSYCSILGSLFFAKKPNYDVLHLKSSNRTAERPRIITFETHTNPV